MSPFRPLVFAGPSLLDRDDSEFEYRPPAAAGDLIKCADAPIRTLVLIDGVFDAHAAVQHKEILELLSRGFQIFGAASMGALRAAELHRFGMIGVGKIFEAFATGRLTADDEVAVLHAPAELGYRPVTVSLVEIRATLVAAMRARLLSRIEAHRLRAAAQSCFWRERSWERILADCNKVVAPATLSAFATWVPTGHVPIKRLDASRCLRQAVVPQSARAVYIAPPRTSFFVQLANLSGIDLS